MPFCLHRPQLHAFFPTFPTAAPHFAPSLREVLRNARLPCSFVLFMLHLCVACFYCICGVIFCCGASRRKWVSFRAKAEAAGGGCKEFFSKWSTFTTEKQNESSAGGLGKGRAHILGLWALPEHISCSYWFLIATKSQHEMWKWKWEEENKPEKCGNSPMKVPFTQKQLISLFATEFGLEI